MDSKITVFILSWERPLYLWASLDSLLRYSGERARFILADNASADPLVHEVIAGFERRGMFHEVVRDGKNDPHRLQHLMDDHPDLLGEYFAFVESDVIVESTAPSWLDCMKAHMDADPALAMVGSYCDPSDFADPDRFRHLAGGIGADEFRALLKADSPERTLPSTAALGGIPALIRPFNPPGRLLLLRTEAIRRVGVKADAALDQALTALGYRTAIATGARHRHLSLLNVFHYPDYSMADRYRFFSPLGVDHQPFGWKYTWTQKLPVQAWTRIKPMVTAMGLLPALRWLKRRLA